ncbi:hypothetical protein BJ508DRAFT_416698 [Ascobolus immersus RN42]|uniref:Uncharacterized protein n=1 Tax=Ascobolus immersus RN42 TaxID=1160509 RepID=A0A3N4I1F9_ASCIM|nr:hypothetical protein BJ508DRAFT_416698 [Ascobolus immersus RN42]
MSAPYDYEKESKHYGSLEHWHEWGRPDPSLVMNHDKWQQRPFGKFSLASRFTQLDDSVWTKPLEPGNKAATRSDIRQVMFNMLVEVFAFNRSLDVLREECTYAVAVKTRFQWHLPRRADEPEEERSYLLICPGNGRDKHLVVVRTQYTSAKRIRGSTPDSHICRKCDIYLPQLILAECWRMSSLYIRWDPSMQMSDIESDLGIMLWHLHTSTSERGSAYLEMLKQFLARTRFFRPQKCWLILQALRRCHDTLTRQVPGMLRLIGKYPGTQTNAGLFYAQQAIREVMYKELAILPFMWDLRAPSVEGSLIRHCPTSPECWRRGGNGDPKMFEGTGGAEDDDNRNSDGDKDGGNVDVQ